ncbi:MAG: DNA repair protein RecN [Rikenellaceae bacterium]
MLQSLTVENYALIERLEMNLDGGLNIITGETGAGKSILLGALGLLLGAKNDGTATKDNTKSCIIEGTFAIGALEESLNLKALFESNDWEYEEQISIRRIITAAGKSRAFIGDIPVGLAELKELSSKLIDIHSQNQNQILAQEAFRIRALDLLYDSKALVAKYKTTFEALQTKRAELRRIEEMSQNAQRDAEWIAHQAEELTAAKLVEGEVEQAEQELKTLENAGAIGAAFANFCARMDSDDEKAILVALKSSERELHAISESYPAAAEYHERVVSALAELKDLTSTISAECDSVEADPAKLERVSARLDVIYSLIQKHRAQDLAELIEIRDRYVAQMGAIEGSDEHVAALRAEVAALEKSAAEQAKVLSAERQKAAPAFSDGICKTLFRLGMEQSRFEVRVTPNEEGALNATGCDSVEFLFSSVVGKVAQSVDKIASGGEVSRVMLALKAFIARRMELPTIIFDEIDTGVSGRIADSMGEIIAELSEALQVIDITHLPQVASKGSSHFVVYKDKGRTNISRLTPDQRVQHIATMLSGSTITAAALEQAQILLSGE